MNVPTAWGPDPGRWPLPSATDPTAKWHRAVALGGQGRYKAAAAELDALEAEAGVPVALRSLMASTRASWSRQTGGHAAAAAHDGAALALVGLTADSDSASGSDSADVVEAQCDALTGLAADMLGVGRLATSDALLTRCGHLLDLGWPPERMWRQQLRMQWVRAELAMVSGDGRTALRHALDARERSTDTISLRHRVKTELITAAAYCTTGEVGDSRTIAYSVVDVCAEHGLVPLRWAAAMLLNGLGEVTTALPIADECAVILRHRGAVLAGA